MAVRRMLGRDGEPIVGWPEGEEDQPHELVMSSNGLAGWRPATHDVAAGLDQVGPVLPLPAPSSQKKSKKDDPFDVSGLDQPV